MREPVNADDISVGVDNLLRLLMVESTGRRARNEYIRELNNLLEASQRSFAIGVAVRERDDVLVSEFIGKSLSDLQFIGINDEDKRFRGVMQFRDEDWKSYRMPLNLLGEEFSINVHNL